jgi:hypothetical protein
MILFLFSLLAIGGGTGICFLVRGGAGISSIGVFKCSETDVPDGSVEGGSGIDFLRFDGGSSGPNTGRTFPDRIVQGVAIGGIGIFRFEYNQINKY